MKTKMLAAIAALSLAGSAQAAIVNLSGTANASVDGANAVTLTLDAGTYGIRFVQDEWTAFNRFGTTANCNAEGKSCDLGWENSVRYIIDGQTFVFGDRGAAGQVGAQGDTYYSTAALSFAASQSYFTTFTLTDTTDVAFFVPDDFLGDNVGGISLAVNAVPEPATWAMMIAGFGLAGAAMRRRAAKPSFA